MDHYAQAFFVEPDHCFRFVHSGVGHAAHCPEAVVWNDQFTDGGNKRWQVDACAEHAEELSKLQPTPRRS
jgi:hypothetical protein